MPSSTGHVRRIVDMTACDTEIDHDSDNSAPADAPPPRVRNLTPILWNWMGSQTLTVCQALSFLLKRKWLILDPLISLNIDAR